MSSTPAPFTDDLSSAATALGLDDELHQALRETHTEASVPIPLRRDDGSDVVLPGFWVRHDLSGGAPTGLFRTRPELDPDEARALAVAMTWQCALLEVPHGGAGGGLAVDPDGLTPAEVERATRAWAELVLGSAAAERDLVLPDLGTARAATGWIRPHPGGQRGDATAFGLVTLALEVLQGLGVAPRGARVVVQGFGKVGVTASRHLSDAGLQVLAVGDRHGTVHDPAGLNVRSLAAHAHSSGSVVGFAQGQPVDAQDAAGLPVELLVSCATDGLVTAATARSVQAQAVVEGANRAVTPDAEALLLERGVVVVPGILAGAGGTLARYYGQLQANQARRWSTAELESRLGQRVVGAWTRSAGQAARTGRTLRQAATEIAVARVAARRASRTTTLGR